MGTGMGRLMPTMPMSILEANARAAAGAHRSTLQFFHLVA
jgi:hypothetical protein